MPIVGQDNVLGLNGRGRASQPLGLIAILAVAFGTALAQSNAVSVSAADYAAATALLEGNLQGLVRNESVLPHWLGASGKFWYRRDGNSGPEFVLVSAQGVKSLAFDH